jgi:hypothetical protein
VILLLGSGLFVAAQETQEAEAAQQEVEPREVQAEGPDCSRWSFKNLTLGMTLGEVKEAHPAASPDRRQGPSDLASHAYSWAQREDSGVTDFTVLLDDETDEAKVVQIRARIQGEGISPQEWHRALLDKWGGIAEIRENDPAAGQTTVEGRSVDDTCDVRVEFRGTGTRNKMSVRVTLTSIQAQADWQRRQVEGEQSSRAKELLE